MYTDDNINLIGSLHFPSYHLLPASATCVPMCHSLQAPCRQAAMMPHLGQRGAGQQWNGYVVALNKGMHWHLYIYIYYIYIDVYIYMYLYM